MSIYSKIILGTYYDSAALMRVQKALSQDPEIAQVGVMMGTTANKLLLAKLNLDSKELDTASAQDLMIVIKSDNPSILEKN